MASMFEKIPQKDRKKFVLSAFVYMPISFIISMFLAYIIWGILGFELKFWVAFFAVFVTAICFILSIYNYYKTLITPSNSN